MKPVKINPTCRDFVSLFLAVTLLSFSSRSSFGQNRLEALDPILSPDPIPVIAMGENACYVALGDEIVATNPERLRLVPSPLFTNGYLKVNRPAGAIREGRSINRFVFSIAIKSTHYFDDCFLAIKLVGHGDNEDIIACEIDDIVPGEVQTITVRPVVADRFETGLYEYSFFSAGREIYHAVTNQDLRKATLETDRFTAFQNSPPSQTQYDPNWIAKIADEDDILIEVVLNEYGYSVDHNVIQCSNPYLREQALSLSKRKMRVPEIERDSRGKKTVLLKLSPLLYGEWLLEPYSPDRSEHQTRALAAFSLR